MLQGAVIRYSSFLSAVPYFLDNLPLRLINTPYKQNSHKPVPYKTPLPVPYSNPVN